MAAMAVLGKYRCARVPACFPHRSGVMAASELGIHPRNEADCVGLSRAASFRLPSSLSCAVHHHIIRAWSHRARSDAVTLAGMVFCSADTFRSSNSATERVLDELSSGIWI